MTIAEKLERLTALRKKLLQLQTDYPELLCSEEPINEETVVERAYLSLLWQVDEEFRRVANTKIKST